MRYLVVAVLIILTGCNKKSNLYEYAMYQNSYLKFWRESINQNIANKIEDGDFLVMTPEGDTLMFGKYKNGFKEGEWKYYPTNIKSIKVDWTKYNSEDDPLSINYPIGWQLIKSKRRPFQATFPTTSEMKGDKYFIILQHKEAEISMTLDKYWETYNQQTFQNDSVQSYLLRKFSRDEGEYFFSTYTIRRNSEELMIFNFLGEMDSTIYDITYSSLKDEEDKKYTIFLDMMRSLRVDNKRFFTPFDQSTEIIDLEYPPKPQITS